MIVHLTESLLRSLKHLPDILTSQVTSVVVQVAMAWWGSN